MLTFSQANRRQFGRNQVLIGGEENVVGLGGFLEGPFKELPVVFHPAVGMEAAKVTKVNQIILVAPDHHRGQAGTNDLVDHFLGVSDRELKQGAPKLVLVLLQEVERPPHRHRPQAVVVPVTKPP